MINILRNITTPITNTIYLTLSDKQTAPSDWYWFQFTNRLTNDVIVSYFENISTTSSYQKFEFDSDIFTTLDSGYWTYEVKESNANHNAPVGNLLEIGYLYLQDDEVFEPIKYSEQSNNFKTYNGQ